MTVLLDERIAAMDRILDSRRGELDRLVRRALETLPPITLDGAPPADVTPQLLELVRWLAERAHRLNSLTELKWIPQRLLAILNLYDDMPYIVDGQERPVEDRKKLLIEAFLQELDEIMAYESSGHTLPALHEPLILAFTLSWQKRMKRAIVADANHPDRRLRQAQQM
ncbi:hypothetical protein NMY22_g10767 [Coprinellus aureogranulatus]|nr:hypothetical protein NMY22_g10767 [Coprinellus aureogranulatus]